jgi:hypothetical protein
MFQTKVEIPQTNLRIGYKDSIMTLGSCFAENIGTKLKQSCFEVDINPFGVLFNPVSIKQSIDLLLQNKPFTESDLFLHNELWQSYSHSSQFSDITTKGCLNKINSRYESASKSIRETDILLITLGTAWVYEEIKTGNVVSNCHKMPTKEFERRKLEVGEIVDTFSCLMCSLLEKKPTLQIIISVSPIRHWKDGALENSVSKSILLLAANELQEQFDNVQYFPAYEIMMDELRDYRFYATDMLHPSEVAIDYIWQRFGETYFDETTRKIKKEIDLLTSDLSHRPLFPESPEFIKFSQKTLIKKQELLEKYPFLNGRI